MGKIDRRQPEERRRFPRVGKPYMVRYRAQTEVGSKWRMSPLRDLSHYGAKFICDRRFAIGAVLEMQLILPTSREPVEVTARILRASQVKLGFEMVEHAVTFTPSDSGVVAAIDDAIARAEKQERGKR